MDKKLESRIARLEKLLNRKPVKNEAHRLSFEDSLDIDGARRAAEAMATRFENQTGHNLIGVEDHLVSPLYGDLGLDEEIPSDDPDTRYVFVYEDGDDPDLSFWMIPSDNKVQAFNNYSCCAYDPKSNSWFEVDCAQDGAFKLSMWRNRVETSDDEDEEFESRKRRCERKRCR